MSAGARGLAALVALSLGVAASAASAQSIQEFRCSADALDASMALQRLEWARKCGLLVNSGGAANYFSSGRAYDAQNFPTVITGAKEYRESNPNRAYSGNTYTFDINYYASYYRYDGAPVFTVAQETAGPTAGFFKWTATTQRTTPLYPSFGTQADGLGAQLVPLPTVYNDCNLYQWNPSTGALTRWTGNFYVTGYCEAGCYAPDQKLRFAGAKGEVDVEIAEAMRAQRDDVVTLSPDATLDDLRTQTAKVLSYTTETRDAEHVIFTITTASGGVLRVTHEHPLVTSEGRLVRADKLKKGDELLKADGAPDAIVTVEKTKHYGKVYNLRPQPREPVANLLIAQGYLVGSARFQNEYVSAMNRLLLFRAVPEEVLPR